MADKIKEIAIAFCAVPFNLKARKRLIEYTTAVLRATSVPFKTVTKDANIVLVATSVSRDGYITSREFNSIREQHPGAEIIGLGIIE